MNAPDKELSAEISAMFAELRLAESLEDVGSIDLADPDPSMNGFLAKWPQGVVLKVADIYSGDQFQERSALLKDGCRMPAEMFMAQWQHRGCYCGN